MPMLDRAALFSPFAALTVCDDAIRETGRLTDAKIEITKEDMTVLNLKYQVHVDRLEDKYEVIFTYFVPDKLDSVYTSNVV